MIGIIFWLCITGVFYSYLGYPLILKLLSLMINKPLHSVSITPAVTMIIPAYNEELVIGKKIENSLQLDYPEENLQILVTDDGSDDRTKEIVEECQDPRIEISSSPQRSGKMNAINRAIKQAKGEIIVISDATAMYVPNAMRALMAAFADPQVGIAAGSHFILPGDGALGDTEGLYWKYEAFVTRHETMIGSCTGISGANMAVRRDLFESPPSGIITEDFYMAMRMIRRGWRVVFIKEASCYERVSPTAREEMERRTRIVAGRFQAMSMAGNFLPWNNLLVVWQVFSHKFSRPLVPFLMILAFLVNIFSLIWPARNADMQILFLSEPYNWIIFFLQCLFYIIAVLGNQWKIPGKIGKLFYIPVFLVNANISAVLGFIRFLGGKQSTRWQRVNRKEI